MGCEARELLVKHLPAHHWQGGHLAFWFSSGPGRERTAQYMPTGGRWLSPRASIKGFHPAPRAPLCDSPIPSQRPREPRYEMTDGRSVWDYGRLIGPLGHLPPLNLISPQIQPNSLKQVSRSPQDQSGSVGTQSTTSVGSRVRGSPLGLNTVWGGGHVVQ